MESLAANKRARKTAYGHRLQSLPSYLSKGMNYDVVDLFHYYSLSSASKCHRSTALLVMCFGIYHLVIWGPHWNTLVWFHLDFQVRLWA